VQCTLLLQGNAAIHILRSAFGVAWSDSIRIIFAGDDLTDEDAMVALQGLAYSFRVVNSELVQTVANHRLPDTAGVLAMLLGLETFMLERR
jgi:trehalose 6-phosphate synthase/phosphatase